MWSMCRCDSSTSTRRVVPGMVRPRLRMPGARVDTDTLLSSARTSTAAVLPP